MGRKTKLILLAVLIILIGVGVFVSITNKSPDPTSVLEASNLRVNDPDTGLGFSYNDKLLVTELTDQDKKDKFIFRLSNTNPPMLVNARYEDGLRIVVSLSKRAPLDILLSNTDKAFPQRFPDYKKLEERKLQVNNKNAAELIFTYKGPSGETVKQRLLIIIKDDDTAIYLSAQTTDKQFTELNQTYFESIFSSTTL